MRQRETDAEKETESEDEVERREEKCTDCVAKEGRKGKTRRNGEIKPLFVGRSTTAAASWALGNLRERSPSRYKRSPTHVSISPYTPSSVPSPLLALSRGTANAVPELVAAVMRDGVLVVSGVFLVLRK